MIRFSWPLESQTGKIYDEPTTIFKGCMCAQLCPILCDPMDCSQPGSSVYVVFQARIIEQVVISFYRGRSQPRDRTCVSCILCIGRWILYHCTTLEAHFKRGSSIKGTSQPSIYFVIKRWCCHQWKSNHQLKIFKSKWGIWEKVKFHDMVGQENILLTETRNFSCNLFTVGKLSKNLIRQANILGRDLRLDHYINSINLFFQ